MYISIVYIYESIEMPFIYIYMAFLYTYIWHFNRFHANKSKRKYETLVVLALRFL